MYLGLIIVYNSFKLHMYIESIYMQLIHKRMYSYELGFFQAIFGNYWLRACS